MRFTALTKIFKELNSKLNNKNKLIKHFLNVHNIYTNEINK